MSDAKSREGFVHTFGIAKYVYLADYEAKCAERERLFNKAILSDKKVQDLEAKLAVAVEALELANTSCTYHSNPYEQALAGISTACIQNTERTIKDRIDKSNPYWTVAYGDVCDTVDREMKLRIENQELIKAHDEMVSINKALQDVCKKIEPEMSKLTGDNKRLREALKVYADLETATFCEKLTNINKDWGTLAKQTLETGGEDG